MDGVKEELSKSFPHFMYDHTNTPVETSWLSFTTILNAAMDTHITKKTLSGRWDHPWMTRDIRTKTRMYKKAKRTNDWQKYTAKQQQVKEDPIQAHQDHLVSILNFDDIDSNQ